MAKDSKESFAIDTSAWLSLDMGHIVEVVLKNFDTKTTSLIIKELQAFAKYDDRLGLVAQRVLKNSIPHETIVHKQHFPVSEADNSIYELAKAQQRTLTTDDFQLAHYARQHTQTAFSTYFILLLMGADMITKEDAFERLEKMRQGRNWENNMIYQRTKEQIAKFE